MIKNWEKFNERHMLDHNFYEVAFMLRDWEKKYQPEDYDGVIEKAFKLINDVMPRGMMSPPFTLPDEQLKKDFIKKFFDAARHYGYDILYRGMREHDGYTTFCFKKNKHNY